MTSHLRDEDGDAQEWKRAFEDLIKEVAGDHEKQGFSYPIASDIPELRYRVTPRIKYHIPSGHDPMYTSALYHAEENVVYVNYDAIVVRPARHALLQKAMESEPDFQKKYGQLHELTLDIAHHMKPLEPSALRALISGVLGAYVLEMKLSKRKDSWLHSDNMQAGACTFTAHMIKAGIIRYFEEMYSPSAESISESVWERDDGNSELENEHGALRHWYVEKCGYGIVSPSLGLHGDRGLDALLTHKLDIGDSYALRKVPEYRNRLFSLLLLQRYR